MNKQILKPVLADNQVEVPRHNVTPRQFKFEDFGNYVLIGIRRAGKSYLLYQCIRRLLSSGIGRDEIQYIYFKDELPGAMTDGVLNLLLETLMEMHGKCPILFLGKSDEPGIVACRRRRSGCLSGKHLPTDSPNDWQCQPGAVYLPEWTEGFPCIIILLDCQSAQQYQ